MARQFDNREKMADLFFAISYYRRRRGMSQEQLAEELGISRQHLAAIEAPNMNRGLSLELLFNIATVLEIEPYLLLKFSPENDLDHTGHESADEVPFACAFPFPRVLPSPCGPYFFAKRSRKNLVKAASSSSWDT